MTPDENAGDLRAHAADFAARTGFTYTVLDEAGDVVGCVYIYGVRAEPGVVTVRSWVRADRADLDALLWAAVSTWLDQDWPFDEIRYAPRVLHDAGEAQDVGQHGPEQVAGDARHSGQAHDLEP